MSALCVIDGVPATMGNLCSACVTTLHTTVLSVPRLLTELDVTITKQARQKPTAGGSGERPLVLNIAASEAAADVCAALQAVARLGAGEHERVLRASRAATELAPWTARRLARAVRRPEIAVVFSDLVVAVGRGWRSVDRAPERRVLGVCDCGGALATHRSEGEIRCPSCGVLWEIEDLEQSRWERLRGVPVTITEALQLVESSLGTVLPRKTVESWISRGHLRVQGARPVRVVFGELVDLWEAAGRPGVSLADTAVAGDTVGVS